jgi:glycosyltransferase involved in cell wall biosynthesis
MPSLSESQLNLIYNACEVGLNTAAAEGFGLVAFEHAAAGGAQVMPAIGSLPELWNGAAELMEATTTTTPAGLVADWHLVEASKVAQTLQRLYDDRPRLQELSSQSRARAHEPRFRWAEIGEQWIKRLAETLQQGSDSGVRRNTP